MNPVNKFLQMKEKRAGWWSNLGGALKGRLSGEAVGSYVAPAIVGAGMATGGLAAKTGIEAVRNKLMAKHDYKRLVEANPQLRGMDSKQVNMVFNSLRRLSPTMAKDPLLAGSFVYKTISLSPESGLSIDPMTAKTIAETQRNIQQGKSMKIDVMEGMMSGLGRQMGPQFSFGGLGPQVSGPGAMEHARQLGLPTTMGELGQQRLNQLAAERNLPEPLSVTYGMSGPNVRGTGAEEAARGMGLPMTRQEASLRDIAHQRALETQRINLQKPPPEMVERSHEVRRGPGGEITESFRRGSKGPR